MTRISQKLKTDKRANAIIKADVLKTKVYLQYNNFKIVLSTIEARRIAQTLNKALSIQITDSEKLSTPLFLSSKNSLEHTKNSLEPTKYHLEGGGLAICYKVANMLKDNFPNEIMKIKDDTILIHSTNDRKIHGGLIAGYYAYYSRKYKRIVIKRKVLNERKIWYHEKFYYPNRFKGGHYLFGKFALIELICHELAHHRTSGHAKGFKIKYSRYFDFMVNQIISGKFYL